MRFTHHDLSIDLEDDWWAEAEMPGFVRASNAYRADPSFAKDEPILEIPIADIGPVHRSVGIFRNSEDGIPARERVLKILRGFRQGDAIPPIQVVECKSGSAHRYKLTAGTHRLYCSLAAGFTHVPAVKGFDWGSIGVHRPNSFS
jgi:hypothetical protein